jgi:hypothetical protein
MQIGWTAPDVGAPNTPAQYLAEPIDVATGELLSIVDGLHPVDAIVVEQVRVRRGSGAAVTDQGQAFDRIQYNDRSAAAALTFEAHAIFDPLVAKGWVEIVSIETQAGEDQGDTARLRVTYKNLMLQNAEPTTITMGGPST